MIAYNTNPNIDRKSSMCYTTTYCMRFSSALVWALFRLKISSLVKDASSENNTLTGKRGYEAQFPRCTMRKQYEVHITPVAVPGHSAREMDACCVLRNTGMGNPDCVPWTCSWSLLSLLQHILFDGRSACHTYPLPVSSLK